MIWIQAVGSHGTYMIRLKDRRLQVGGYIVGICIMYIYTETLLYTFNREQNEIDIRSPRT